MKSSSLEGKTKIISHFSRETNKIATLTAHIQQKQWVYTLAPLHSHGRIAAARARASVGGARVGQHAQPRPPSQPRVPALSPPRPTPNSEHQNPAVVLPSDPALRPRCVLPTRAECAGHARRWRPGGGGSTAAASGDALLLLLLWWWRWW